MTHDYNLPSKMFLKDLVVQLNGLISYIIETHIFLSSSGLVFQNAKSIEYLLQANPKSESVSEGKKRRNFGAIPSQVCLAENSYRVAAD